MNRSKFVLTLAILIAGCSLIPTSDTPQRTITVGSPLPDREIVFITGENQLGFINDDGSGYVEYPVDMSDWYRARTTLPGLSGFVTWSPDGKYLVSTATHSNRSSGFPVMISMNGELFGCSFETSPLVPYRSWAINDLNLIAVEVGPGGGRVVVFSIPECQVIRTLYSIDTDTESLIEAVISSQGWLAIGLIKTEASKSEYELRLFDDKGAQVASIPGASYPAWSKDGEQIAYSIWDKGLFVSKKDGSIPRRILQYEQWHVLPSWSPDGTWIVYDRPTSTGSSVFKINITSGEEFELFIGGFEPNWKWE
jgi:hypothetical protein